MQQRTYGQTYNSLAGPQPIIYQSEQPHQGKPTRFCESCSRRRVCFKDSGQVLCLPCTKRLGFSANKSAWFLNSEPLARRTRIGRERRINTPALTPLQPRYY